MKREYALVDEPDRRLLQAIQRDASASQAELAEAAGISASLVSRRLSRLRESGVLRAVVGLVDAASVGLSCGAIIRIRLKDHAAASVRQFRDLVTRMEEVTLCVMLTGEADYLLKLIARDLPHFQEIVQQKLLRCPAIAHLESSIILEYLKDTTELPLGAA
ncbi:MAG: Lrp/AsnC family transcriptional regulator [Proteobacteria bacterium]|nr:Lrp/AsnC family transcriptional regulator [Pseudomonadota bacterium]